MLFVGRRQKGGTDHPNHGCVWNTLVVSQGHTVVAATAAAALASWLCS